MPRKRKSGEGGLYYVPSRDLWRGVIDLGFKPDGKRDQRTVSSRSQTKAREKLRALQAEVDQHGSPLGSKTVTQWGTYWLEEICKPKMKPQPWRTYQSILKTWVLPYIGRKNVQDVRPSDLRNIYDTMKQQGKSSSTALKAHNVMSSMFEAARLERIVRTNVAEDIRPPKAAKSTRDALTPDETRRVLEVASARPDASKWFFSFYAGPRQGERLGATIDSVDLDRGTFTIQWSLAEANYDHGCGNTCGKTPGRCPKKRLVLADGLEHIHLKGRYVLVRPKSGEPRTFPLPPTIINMLALHIQSLTLQPNPYHLLWPAPNGSYITAREDQAEWKALLLEAGVDRPDATTHWARHTAISDLTSDGAADRVIGEIVGHKSPGVTGRYQHVYLQDTADAMNSLAKRRELDS